MTKNRRMGGSDESICHLMGLGDSSVRPREWQGGHILLSQLLGIPWCLHCTLASAASSCLPLSSHGILPGCASVSKLNPLYKDTSQIRPMLLHYDLILTNYLDKIPIFQ